MVSVVKRRKPSKINAFLKLARLPNLLVIGSTQYLVALFIIRNDVQPLSKYILNPQLFLLVSSTCMIAAAGYVINDYYDIKIDLVNRPDRVIAGRIIERRWVIVIHFLLTLIGVGLGLVISFKVALVHCFSAFSLWFYSNYLRRKPFVGNLLIAFLTFLSILLVGLYFKNNLLLVSLYATFAFTANLVREIVKDLEDLKGEKHFGCETLPVLIGITRTKKVINVITFLSILILTIFLIYLEDLFLTLYFTTILSAVVFFLFKLRRADSRYRFNKLNNLLKLIILAGVISMVFI
ncbi:MAG TPA: geranylgeranylglycerol-phosphate geranylgeranyltransferase [Cyclobacteriaceae bacterium]